MQNQNFKFATSSVTADGHFKGYGAVFGNLDSHRDVIERGAFTASLAVWNAKGRFPSMRLQHGSAGNPFRHDDLPIGKWLDMREDSKGLYVEGKLLALETDQGKRLLSLMRASVLDGLSIGYVTRKTRPGAGRVARYLVQLDLREVSLVDEPSNDLARVELVKPADIAFENLRDAILAADTGAKHQSPTDIAFEKLRSAVLNTK